MPAWLTLEALAALAAAGLFGGMAVFSFVVAPLVHGRLDRDHAARLLNALFPAYYLAMAVAAIAGLGLVAVDGTRRAELIVLALIAAGFIAALRVLVPRLATARQARAAGDAVAAARFAGLHRAGVARNLLQMVGAAFVVLRLGG